MFTTQISSVGTEPNLIKIIFQPFQKPIKYLNVVPLNVAALTMAMMGAIKESCLVVSSE